ncbi:MAG: amidohydrolase [Proteobacteria bacterium]|nr:amidohydrolase [Pseudomonadota bacterium]
MDLALFPGRVFTGDPIRPWAEAVGVENNRIAVVGSRQEVEEVCSPKTEVLEIPGGLVTPGLVDSHVHFCFFGQTLGMVNLKNLPSLTACRQRIEEHLSSGQTDEWIIGRGWDHHTWQEQRDPSRHDLDDLIPAKPALMFRADGHTVWANSAALERANITQDTPDPPGGKIERALEDGQPTGLVREAIHLFMRAMPRTTREDWKKAALDAQREALRFGLTGVHSCETLPQWEALSSLEEEEKLKIRVYHLLRANELEKATGMGIESGRGSQRLWFGHAKLFSDGSLGSGTALLHEPYSDDASQRGLAVSSPEELKEQILSAYNFGWDVAVHAIGDLAVTHCLDAMAEARSLAGIDPQGKRDRIEHVQLYKPDDLNRFRDMGIAASVQPVFTATDWGLAERKWGRERCRFAYAWKSLLEADIPLLFGSDTPFDRIDPRLGLMAAVARQTEHAQPPGGWFPDQRLTLQESLKGFTLLPAWTSRSDDRLGSVSPGKLADLTVFEKNLFDVPPQSWPAVNVELTVVDGEIVYQKK